MEKKLPVYEMVIEENTKSDIGVSFIALVNLPAIEKNFMAFNSMKVDFQKDEERRIISGPAMVADSLIYRLDDTGEYNVFFSKKTIECIALKFFKMDFQKNLNLFHDPKLSLDGVTIFESFVADSARGILPMKGFEDLPDGTWFISCKIENDDVWEKIKSGEVKGFSVEGIFSFVKPQQKTIEEQIEEILSRTLDPDGHLEKTDIMSSVKEMVAKFKKSFFNEEGSVNASGETKTDYALKDGTLCTIDKLEVGGVVLVGGVPAAAGEHELTDGTKITTGEGGVIAAVVPPVEAPAATPVNDNMTHEQRLQSVKEAVEKFAVGTPEQRLANLEIVAKALMEYSFGWEIRKAQEEADRAAAINIYKTGFDSHKSDVATLITNVESAFQTQIAEKIKPLEEQLTQAAETIKKQDEIIKSLFSLVEKIAELPTDESVGGSKTNFSSDKASKKEARLKAISDSLTTIIKSKTA